MTAILDPIEFTASDGQKYNAVFEHFFARSPNSCDIFLNGGKIGEAIWCDEAGLMERFSDNDLYPVMAWGEVCDRIEKEYGHRLEGHKRASHTPAFRTVRDELLRYKEGQWVGDKTIYGARVLTGYPVEDDTLVEGTFLHV